MCTQENNSNNRYQCSLNSVQCINIIVQKTSKKRKMYKLLRYSRQKPLTKGKAEKLAAVKHNSMPEIKTHVKMEIPSKISDAALRKSMNCHSKFDFNFVSAYRNPIQTGNPFHNQTRLKIYRCQLSSKEESCCCSCNSDAMFEVMKSLYDCYKKKDCDHCNCILCGHLPREERRLGESRKSIVRSSVAVGEEEYISPRERKKVKSKKAVKEMAGKTTAEKEKILRDLVKSRATLPEPKTASEKELIKKIRTEYGLPQEPKTSLERVRIKRAEAAGAITPLSGKTPWQKEKILKEQAEMGIPLPEGRTPSEKALIEKVKATTKPKIPSEKWRKAKEAGLLTPLEDKTPEQKERILRGLAMQGLPLPEGQTPSEREMIKKTRAELGLPPEPKTSSLREKYKKAADAGIMVPLEGKTPSQKEKILQKQAERGIPLPEGKTPSEKALIEKVKATTKPKIPSEKWRKAKEAGLLTPLEDKTPEQKERILRGLAMQGLPLPEGQTPSEKEMIKKIRAELGLPPEPKTSSLREKYKKAADAGIMVPLEGKTPSQKEKILQKLAERGIPLPEGRTPSEKALISKVKAATRPPSEGATVSRRMEKAKAAGLLTPLEGKSPEHKEKILKGRVMAGIPLPEPRTASEKKIHDKIRADLGLPPEPKTSSHRQKYEEALAAGHIEPLEGKSPSQKEKILRAQHEMGIPLPEGRTASEKELIQKITAKRKTKSRGITVGRPALSAVKRQKLDEKTAKVVKEGKGPADECICDLLTPESEREKPARPEPSITTEKIRKAKTAGLLTPLQGKSPEEKERILTGLAKSGLPLPKGKTASEKALIQKVKTAAGVPEKTESQKLRRAKETGLMTPLEGKTLSRKEKILRGRAAAGLPLPSGKSPSEKQLIKKIKADTGYVTPTPSEKMAKAKAAGLLTPLEGKTPSEKAKIIQRRLDVGLPPPEGTTPSEKVLIKKVTEAAARSKRIPSEKIRKAKAAGLLTPLQGKTSEQKEKILKGLVEAGLPLPEPKTASEKELIQKIRQEAGLPPEPKSPSHREKYLKAHEAGIITPLQGKSPSQKVQVLQKLQDAGIPLPEGRTASEKALVQRVKAGISSPKAKIPSEKLRAAKAAGLLTPLEGKTPEQKEKILRGLAKAGVPLPEAKTESEKELVRKVRKDMGLPPTPKTLSVKERLHKAHAAGLVTPLEGKTPSHKERIVRELAKAKLPLPEGRTSSEKVMIRKVQAETKSERKVTIPSEKIRKAKAAGLLTPLEGKSPEEKEKIMKGLAMEGIPLPEPKTSSEKMLMEKIRTDIGLPPEPKSPSERRKFEKAMAEGLIAPLEGKTHSEKARIIKTQAQLGMALPEGRTSSEKALISKIKTQTKVPSKVRIPSEKLRKAKEAGFLTPLKGKTPEEKERILKGLAMHGIPIPEPKTSSHRMLAEKVRADLGLPPEPKTLSERQKHEKAVAAGIIKPLEGMTRSEKFKTLKAQADMGLILPEGRTTSEKELIAQVKAEAMARPPSERIRKAQAAGLVSPLEGKTPSHKERILRNMAEGGMPLPEGKSPSERALIQKVRKEMGLPPEPQTLSTKERMRRAHDAGLVIPLEGKTPSQKEKILRDIAEAGVPLPQGRTASEKALISKVQASTQKKPRRSIRPPLSPKEAQKLNEKTAKIMKEGTGPADECICDILAPEIERRPVEPMKTLSDKMRQAKAAGLLTPLEGKTPEHKERILRELAKQGLPMPEAKTSSERKLAEKVRADIGLPMAPKTASEKLRHAEAHAAGLIVPLEGKTPSEKEKILQTYVDKGLTLPEGRTASEKAIIAKVKSQAIRQPKVRIPSEKMRQAKAAGLITPLEGKTPEEKERIIKGLAMAGIPLPKAQTASEKRIIDKVHTDLGLPPRPKTFSEQKRFDEAVATGVVVPLEGKSPSEKIKILRDQAALGLALPEGRTPSEIALISKVKAETRAPTKVRIPSEKLREAKAAGLITPLEGKTPEEKERIIKGLAMAGIPLPKAQTASEKRIIDKVHTDLGLPPRPKTLSEQKRFDEAVATGVVVPLEGKSPSEKIKILRDQAALGLALPEGRTPSEMALISKVKAETRAPTKVRIPSAKLREAKAAGLITPLEGKAPEEKERIIKGLAMAGIPLPKAQTASERRIIDKVHTDLGLPPRPKTLSEQKRFDEAVATGVVVPLEGKSPSEKIKILRDQAALGLALPEGRTPSEKALIARVKKEMARPRPVLQPHEIKKLDEKTAKVMKEGKGPADECICDILAPPSERITKKLPPRLPVKVSSEIIRKAKAAGLLTPLEGKTPSHKERIIKGLAMQGMPIPEPKTASEQKLVQKVRMDLGLPPEPKSPSEKQRYYEAHATGRIVPLEGKTASVKEKTLRAQAQMGLPLPEGRTSSEKALIAKVKAETRAQIPTKVRIPSEKIRKAKVAGVLTPLSGKSPQEKEKILIGLAMHGIPLPEGKTPSEQKIIDKVRFNLGLPPLPRTASERNRYDKAIASGVIVPLEGKTPAEKEKTLRAQLQLGIPLPEGRTPSEKSLIIKIKAESQRVPSEKLRKAKAAGFMTPLDGKTKSEKEKIVRGLVEMGLPMPEGKSASEKAMLHKIRIEMGLPPPARTPSEKERIRDAKAEGLFTPLAGKSAAHKERILKGLADAGLPLPEGQTASERELVKKVKTAAGLPLQPSERRAAIRSKSKKIGISEKRRVTKGIGAGKIDRELAKAGVTQEFEDIEKTTTCDRACGCDRKKIRFKHSYVKIRVTSPDISSLCPCPEECLPGVKGGVFTDSEGIKVTIGNAIGVPLFCNKWTSKKDTPENYSPTCKVECLFKSGAIFMSSSEESLNKYVSALKESLRPRVDICVNKAECSSSTHDLESSPSFEVTITRSKSLDYVPKSNSMIEERYHSSSDTVLTVKSETSLSFTTNSYTTNTISVVTFVDSNYTISSQQYLSNSLSENSGHNTASAFEDSECYTDLNSDENAVASKEFLTKTFPMDYQDENEIKISESNIVLNEDQNSITSHEEDTEPVIVLDEAASDHDIISIVDDLLSGKEFSDASSIYIVVTSSEEYLSTETQSSTHLQISGVPSKASSLSQTSSGVSSIACALKISRKGKTDFAEKISSHPKPRLHIISNRSQTFAVDRRRATEDLEQKLCQVTPDETKQPGDKHNEISTDTTQDRPCCCRPYTSPNYNKSNTQCVANVISEVKAPIKQLGLNRGLENNACPAPDNTMFTQSSFSSHTLAPPVTPVRVCQVASPSAAYKLTAQNQARKTYKRPDGKNEQSSCMKSVPCGNRINASLKKNVDTSTADRYPKPIIMDSKMGKKNEKKVTLVPPCIPGLGKDSVGCQCCLHGGCREGPSVQFFGVGAIDRETTETFKPEDALLLDHCVCQNKPGEDGRKKKKVICMCPQAEPEPDYMAYENYEFTQEDIWKMRSVITQATSGFKLVMNKKPPESQMSFEEALDYYARMDASLLNTDLECDANSPGIKIRGGKCDCEAREKRKYKICECPKEDPRDIKEGPWKGLKFAIGGKGSASKGLSGICCFDMYQDSRTFIKIKIKAVRQSLSRKQLEQ